MGQGRIDRRTFLSVGSIGVVAAAVGARAVLAQDDEGTPPATPGTPGATPGASPAASPAAGGAAVTVKAVDINFDPAEFSIPADTDVEITVTNEGVLQHDFYIEDTDFHTDLLDGGSSQTITVNLAAGDYVYYCNVPGHREQGMEGKLTVE